MSHSSNTADGSNAPQPFPVLNQYGVQQDDYSPPLVSLGPMNLDLSRPFHTHSILLVGVDHPAATVGFLSPSTSSTIPPVGAVSLPNIPPSTNPRRTKKNHPCAQCGRAFTRRELAEGCRNRHQKLRPFSCTKQCGDLNWYIAYFSKCLCS
jgi:hypothetical protein